MQDWETNLRLSVKGGRQSSADCIFQAKPPETTHRQPIHCVETGAAISGKEPAAIAANKGQVIKDKAASATGKVALKRASTANSTALSPPIVLQSSPVPDAACVDPSHPRQKGAQVISLLMRRDLRAEPISPYAQQIDGTSKCDHGCARFGIHDPTAERAASRSSAGRRETRSTEVLCTRIPESKWKPARPSGR